MGAESERNKLTEETERRKDEKFRVARGGKVSHREGSESPGVLLDPPDQTKAGFCGETELLANVSLSI